MKRIKLAFVGVGSISDIYLKNLTEVFKQLEVVGVCDLVRERAEAAAEKYRIPRVYADLEELLADPEVEIVLNLTRPYEHYVVTKAALEAGKHVYTEKPLAATVEEGEELIQLAADKGLMIAGAPDTFLGASIQTCRKLIEDGYIGEPIAFQASMICRGHESWHPDPAFYYQRGGGPMFDMGPYYLTALVNLLGKVKGVTSLAKKSFSQRTITSQPLMNQVVDVEVPTYLTGIMEFENGVVGHLTTTFDVVYKEQARFEIYGSEGTLIVPDPNMFGDKVYLLRIEDNEYKEMPLLFDYRENSRGLGIADMADALANNRQPRVNVEQLFHVLDVMDAFERSSQSKAYEAIESDFELTPLMKRTALKGVVEG
ncbi:Gfo/Idh/MocA family protein [Fundicoccus sp. Sow4_H7]|uniref:Gfo/Idh/MocA family protein n=1 Tax=Fundicoccus sp. Sow4_H7 TaxID=3438784 RepID=UPI003F931EBF